MRIHPFIFMSDTLSCECKLTCLKFGTIFRLLLCPLNPMQKEFRSHYSISEQFPFCNDKLSDCRFDCRCKTLNT